MRSQVLLAWRWRLVLMLLALSSGATAVGVREVGATTTFATRFSTNAQGDIAVVANTVLTCAPSSSCTSAQNGAASDNNSFTMVFVDVDSDASTFNSSSADLAIPPGAEVLFAGLYWGADLSAGSGGSAAPNSAAFRNALLKTPGAGAYSPVTSTSTDPVSNNTYTAFVDVTAQVKAAGNGTYTVANIQAGRGNNRYGGWAILVAYRLQTLPLRRLLITDGFVYTYGATTATITVSGLVTPPTGTVTGEIIVVSYEGDRSVTPGKREAVTLNGQLVGNSLNPTDNLFNSSITNRDARVTTKNPNFDNQLGFDADILSIDGLIPNNATSVTLQVVSEDDGVLTNVVAFVTDLLAPDIQVTKSATDLTNGAPLRPGDEVEYSVTVRNAGGDIATAATLTDQIPVGMAYVPGSLRIVSGAGAGAKTDAVDSDQAHFDAARHQVVVHLGTGANVSTGGTLAINDTITIAFRARLGASIANGTSIRNTATVSVVGSRSGAAVTESGSADLTVTNQADLRVTKSVSKPTALPGEEVSFTITARNAGGNPVIGATLTDTFPSQLAGVKWSCVGADGGSCGTGAGAGKLTLPVTLPVNGSVTVTATGTVDGSAAPATVTNTATLTAPAGVAVDTPASTTASASFAIPAHPVLGLAKRVASLRDNGDGSFLVTFAVSVRNYGNVPLTQIEVFDDLAAAFAGSQSAAFEPGSFVATGGFATLDPAYTGQGAGTRLTSGGTLGVGQAGIVTFMARVRPGGKLSGYANSATGRAQGAGQTVTDISTPGSNPDPDNNGVPSEALPTLISFATNADLAVEITAPSGPIYATEPATYTVKVTNNGPSQATGVVLNQTFDQPVQIVSTSPASAGCTTAADVTCGLGAINSGDSVTVTVVVRPTRDGGLLSRATVTSAVADPHPDNNTAARGIVVLPAADLALTKTVTPANPLVGQTVTATLTVTNNGPSPATHVSLTDQLLGGTTFASATTSPAGLPCGPSGGGVVSCDLATLPSGGSVVVTLTYAVDATGVLTDLGSVTSDVHDPVATNNGASGSVTASALADLSVTKTAPATAATGQTISYAITVSNAGPSPARNVAATDQLPAGVTFVSATASQGSCSSSGQDRADCQLGTIPAGGSATMTVQGTVTKSGTLTNSVVALAAVRDPDLTNNRATATTTATGTADLVATLTASPTTIAQNGTVTFTGSVTNNGPDQATSPVLRFVATNAGALTASSPQGPCNVSGAIVECTVANMPPGATAQVTVAALAPTFGLLGGILSGTANEPDPNAANNVQTAVVTVGSLVGPPVNLQVTKIQPPVVISGQAVPVLITVDPNGGVAPGTVVTHVLPPGLTPSGTPTTSQGTCTTPQPGLVNCDLGTVTAPVTITVPTTATGSGAQTTKTGVTTTAPVTTPAATTTTGTTTVTANADLGVAVAPSAASVDVNTPLTFTVTVSNAGPDAATDVALSTLLSGVAFDVTAITPSQGACATGASATCDLGSIPVGGSATVTVTGTPRAVGNLVNAATVSSTSTDPIAGNNAASAGVDVTALADLQVTLTASPNPVAATGGLTYTATIRNLGPSAVADAVAVGALDRVASLVSVTTSQGTCRPLDGLLVCELGPLAANGVVTISAVVTEDAAGVLVGGVAVVGTEPDPTDDNNVAFAQVRVIVAETTTPPVTVPPVTTPPVPEARNDPNNDDEQENREPRTEEQRQQRERSNAGNQDDERTEGEVMAVRCSAGPIDDPVGWMDDGKDTPYVVIANRDGLQKVRLWKDARSACDWIRVGQYLSASGEKESEQLFNATDVDAD